MLQLAQRTSAPSETSVSMRTAVWMVMCSEPVTRTPARGCCAAYLLRMAMRPGISCSAMAISLRPQSARLMSATVNSVAAISRVGVAMQNLLGIPCCIVTSRYVDMYQKRLMASILKMLRVVADPNRLRILLLLREEELSVAELQEILAMGQSTISTHLAQLKQAGLVEDRRTGKYSLYRLVSRNGTDVLARLLEQAREEIPEA